MLFLSGVFGFIRERLGGRWVHPGLLGSLAYALGVVGLNRGFWIHSSAPCGSLGSFRVVVFARACPGGR